MAFSIWGAEGHHKGCAWATSPTPPGHALGGTTVAAVPFCSPWGDGSQVDLVGVSRTCPQALDPQDRNCQSRAPFLSLL